MFRSILFALGLACAPIAVHAASVFEATVTDAGGFDVTATPGSSFPGNHAQYTGSIFGGEGIAISGVENFSGVLASGGFMTSLSFDVYEPTTPQKFEGCNTTCTDSTFMLELFNGAASIASTFFNPTDDMIFNISLAVAPGQKFDRFVITDTTNTIDNEFFANFRADLAPIPLPATAWLLIAALGSLALRRRIG